MKVGAATLVLVALGLVACKKGEQAPPAGSASAVPGGSLGRYRATTGPTSSLK